ncbi:protein JASON-like isoform X3 [Miscanthus floridulus]|uniref:protein JASON-like isoform X3 n=1 Tax=Miscanthus floridulus TaxID=154761 RepID=UPI00345913FD
MRGCAEAIARTVLAFLDAVILGCLRSCFGARPRRGSGRRDALVHGDQAAAAEVIWDDEEGLVRDGRVHEDLADGGGIDEELRHECDNKPTSGPPANSKLLFEANSSEGYELNTEDAGHHHGVEFVPHSASSEKRLFQNIQHKPLDSSGSPFPTPLVLRDDMQTPGTAYASHRGTSVSGKRVRTRKQFIYPVLRSIENRLKQTELTEDSSPLASSNPLKGRNLESDPIKDPTQRSSTSVVISGLSETPSYSAHDPNASYEVKEAPSPDELLDGKGLPKSNSDEKNVALSLSRWLKSSSADAENQGDVKCPAGDQSFDDCSFLTEKPVLAASDLNLNTDNPTPRLPKAWDGNGIPNTTTRYKEDQRVNWHTTPFEQRLLKVLSDEDRCPPRKVVREKLFHLEEKAE